MAKREAEVVVPGLAPKLDVCLHGSTEVNRARAAQSASVAAVGSEAAAIEVIDVLTPAQVARLAARRSAYRLTEDVGFSVFVQLDRDLDPERRRRTVDAVAKAARRVRWKIDTASVEATADQIRELVGVPGVAYVENGQTLRTPTPKVGATRTAAPSPTLRKVRAQARRHRDGRDVLVGIIDVDGFDFAHPDFVRVDGTTSTTRWEAIWDQGGTTRRPPTASAGRTDDRNALGYGSEIRRAHMDAAIAAADGLNMAATALEPQSVMRPGSHGTHVASIAAGNRGVARQARLAGVLVQLRPEDVEATSSFYDSTRIADAVDYLFDLAAELGGDEPLPVSINISLGTNGHAHDTSSTMARWIDNALTTRGRCVTVAAGNAGQVEPAADGDDGFVLGRIHASGTFKATNLRHELGWIVVGDRLGERVADLSENELEIWYSPQDRIDVEVRPPGGNGWLGPVRPGHKVRNQVLANGTVLSVHSETYYPANGLNRIFVLLSPYFGPTVDGARQTGPVTAGEWRIRLTGTTVRDGRYHAWIERDDRRRLDGPGGWSYPSHFAPGTYTASHMINSLACAERVVSVANIDVEANAADVTSSRGPTRDGRFKPDLGADGTDVVAARGFDRAQPWMAMSGTSMATPYVCGVAALMLNVCPQLTSAQVQGIMLTTSSPLPGHDFAWRADTGFGLIDAEACLAVAAEYETMRGAEP